MTPKEANEAVVQALKDAEDATTFYVEASAARDRALERLAKAREDLEDVLRVAAGLGARYCTGVAREEYLRLHTFKLVKGQGL